MKLVVQKIFLGAKLCTKVPTTSKTASLELPNLPDYKKIKTNIKTNNTQKSGNKIQSRRI